MTQTTVRPPRQSTPRLCRSPSVIVPSSRRSATTTRRSSSWRTRSSGRTSGRWPAGWRRSRKSVTTSSTGWPSTRSWWCVPATNEIKAYQNACRHRATQLALGCGTFRGGQIVCPFHGWRWNLDGTPSGLYGKEGFDPHTLDPEDLKLIECQVATWAGCVFINMDQDAPPFMDAIQPVPEFLDPLLIAEYAGRLVESGEAERQLEGGHRGLHGGLAPDVHPPAGRHGRR